MVLFDQMNYKDPFCPQKAVPVRFPRRVWPEQKSEEDGFGSYEHAEGWVACQEAKPFSVCMCVCACVCVDAPQEIWKGKGKISLEETTGGLYFSAMEERDILSSVSGSAAHRGPEVIGI